MIIGFCGTARSGKDTAAQAFSLFFKGQTTHIQIAGPIKAYCREIFDWTEMHTDGPLKDVGDKRYPVEGGFLTPRVAMQKLGGEFAESTFPSIYAITAARQAALISNENHMAIITDIRYLRDLQAIQKVGGVVLQMHRGDRGLIGAASTHESEVQCLQSEFQKEVDDHFYNRGSKEEFMETLRQWGLSQRLWYDE